MKVLEIKNNLVKIAYETQDNLALSGFVIIQDVNTPYVAQVMNLKADVTANYAIVKLLFTFNEEGILKNYNGTIPSLKSTVTKLPANELLDIIPIDKPLKIGTLAEQETLLQVDKSILDNNLLVCSNNTENTKRLINNLVSQIDEKVVIFDIDGTLELTSKIKFGKDFKLPLNYETINFIYENDLEDVDATSRAVIQDIFLEVQQYTKTLPEGYLPFDTFLNVVDQQYKETQIPQLVLLKNKLLKYKELNVFAQELKDILNFSIAIEQSEILTVDISEVPENLQKEIITYAYNVMSGIKGRIYSFIKIENSNSDKKLLKTLLQQQEISTTIICPHEYKYINILKENAQNLILFTPLTLQHDFASYNTFLNKLNADEFIIYGAHTQNIPLIVMLEDSSETGEDNDENKIQNTEEPKPETVEETNQSSEIISDTITEEAEEKVNDIDLEEEEEIEQPSIIEDVTQEDTVLNDYPQDIAYPDITIEEPVEIVENSQEPEISEENTSEQTEPDIPNILEDIPENIPGEDTIIEETVTPDSQYTKIDDIKVEPLYDDASIEELTEPDEIPIETLQSDTADEEPQTEDDIVQQVAKDVDKALYEKIETEDDISFDNIETDELTEDDLNLIDDINLGNEEDNTLEITDFSEENPPVLPIYPGEDIEAEENQKLEPGDRVSTPKYGEGVVEKMIKYGNKMLCSIEFPNIGRRLLDPAMSEITKLS